MTTTWTLTDVERDLFVENLLVTPRQAGGPATGYRVVKRRLRGGLRDGVDLVEIDNGTFRFAVIPTRGMGLWEASRGETRLAWKSPARGPVHPAFVPLNEPSGIGWLTGFDELLVRCGLESNGAPEFHPNGTLRYGLHGKIANIPAHRVELAIDGDSGEIRLTGVVDEARLFGSKLRLTTTYTTRVGQPGVVIHDRVENLSAEPAELQLLYHVNFGLPLVDVKSKFLAPIRRMAPRDAVAVGNLKEWDTYGPETPGSGEAVFFFDLLTDASGNTRTLLHNSTATRGVSLTFRKDQLPHFVLWKNRQAAGDGYVTGMEPAINFPNTRSFEKEHGRVALLKPHEVREFSIVLEAYDSSAGVAAAKAAVEAIQHGTTPEILPQPNPEWSVG